MTDHPSTARANRLPALVILLIFAAVVYAAARSIMPPSASEVAQAASVPIQPTWDDGAWYWIERENGDTLMRIAGSSPVKVAVADEILDYRVSGDRLIWSGRTKEGWKVSSASKDGSNKRVLWSGKTKPGGLLLDGSSTYWIEQTEPLLQGGEPFPALGPSLKVMKVADGSDQAVALGTIMEPEGLEIVGIRDGALYLTAFRPGASGTTVLYQVGQDGVPVKVAGTAGRQDALLTRNGELYLLTASREAGAQLATAAVRRVNKQGKLEMLSDWLPANGRLVDTNSGLVYVDGAVTPLAWRVRDSRELPQAIRIPDGMAAVGAGGGELLLRPIAEAKAEVVNVKRMGLP